MPLHNQIIPWAMKKNVDVVHRADNRLDWRLIKVNWATQRGKGPPRGGPFSYVYGFDGNP